MYILACVFFAFLAGWSVVQAIGNYVKTRGGIFTKGRLVSVANITASREEGHNKEGEIEFEFPNNSEERYRIKYVFSSFSSVDMSREFIVWINEKKPEKSIIVDRFDFVWWVKLVVFFCVCLILLYLAYIRL